MQYLPTQKAEKVVSFSFGVHCDASQLASSGQESPREQTFYLPPRVMAWIHLWQSPQIEVGPLPYHQYHYAAQNNRYLYLRCIPAVQLL